MQAYYQRDYYTRSPDGSFCEQLRVASSPQPTATLYPNPADKSVDVYITNATESTTPYTVRLFDSYGRQRAEQVSKGEKAIRLKTDHLPAGLYFVHILQGTQVLSREQLKIVH